jgi:hypothetical protein
MDSLQAAGKKATLVALHAALGNRGSITTLVKIKAEIDAETLQQQDSEEGLKTFREVWALAVEEGRRQNAGECAELREAIGMLTTESEQAEGELAQGHEHLCDVEAQRDSLLAQVAIANEQAVAAHAAADQNAAKVAEVMEHRDKLRIEHAQEVSRLRSELETAQNRARELDLALARSEALREAMTRPKAKTKAQ